MTIPVLVTVKEVWCVVLRCLRVHCWSSSLLFVFEKVKVVSLLRHNFTPPPPSPAVAAAAAAPTKSKTDGVRGAGGLVALAGCLLQSREGLKATVLYVHRSYFSKLS